MNRLNIEIVKQAISEIRSTGVYPSFKAILKHVGYGSYSTLTKLKAQYPSVFDTQTTTATTVVAATKSDTLNTENTTPVNTLLTDIDTLNTLINTEINTHFNALEQRFEQRFEQLKSELLDTIKKNDLDINNSSVELVQENQELHQQINLIETNYKRLESNYRDALVRLEELDDFLQKNKDKSETISKLQDDIKRLEETNLVILERSKIVKNERDDALTEVVKLASENTELRSKLEPEVEPVGTIEPEPNSSKSEPENEPKIKFTLVEAHERFIELCEDFPKKKQSELIRILDSEGYKNSKGKRLVPSTISRWHDEWAGKKAAKAGQR